MSDKSDDEAVVAEAAAPEESDAKGAGGAQPAGRNTTAMEKVQERAAALAADKKKIEDEKAARAARIQQGLDDAKKKRRVEDREKAEEAKKRARAAPLELEGLYGGLEPPDPEKDKASIDRLKEKEASSCHRFPTLPTPDSTRVIFLDVDGVLRPLTAGGFRAMMVDGEWALKAETADFFSTAMLALRHIVESTGAIIVLSSEWRRDQAMRDGVDNILQDYKMPACSAWTPTDLERDLGTTNPFLAFTERRAREISTFMSKNPQVRQWVVIDDINMSDADVDRKPGTMRMTERIVQTHRKYGLNFEQAKAAVKILNGEKLPPQILKEQPHVELL